MKKLIFATVFSVSSLIIFAQDNHNRDDRNGNRNSVPAPVQQAWQRDHANEGNPQWNQSTKGEWRGTYQDKTNSRNVAAYYDQKGRQIDTHRQWDQKDLPAQYNEKVNKRYRANGNYNVTKIERPNQSEVYQLKMKNRGRSKTVYTDRNGNEIQYRDNHRD